MLWVVCRAVFFNRGSVEPKGSVSAKQGFTDGHKKNKNKAEINDKVTWLTSNLGYLFWPHKFIFDVGYNYSVTHTPVSVCVFHANY